MSRGRYLGELEALVLTAVVGAGQPANGVVVYRELEARAGREVSLPAIHVTLRRLEAKGLLASEVGGTSARGGRAQRFYRATPPGVRALQEFRAMWRDLWQGLELPEPEARA